MSVSSAIALTFLTAFAAAGSAPKVATNVGTFTGKVITNELGRETEAFLGIRFATSERFEAAQPFAASKDTQIDATNFGKSCMQNAGVFKKLVPDAVIALEPEPEDIAEDCLFLNVWKPKGDVKGLPVMLWIHGGGFDMWVLVVDSFWKV